MSLFELPERMSFQFPLFFSGHGDESLINKLSKYNVFGYQNKPEYNELIGFVVNGFSNNFKVS